MHEERVVCRRTLRVRCAGVESCGRALPGDDMMLAEIADSVRATIMAAHKTDIQLVGRHVPWSTSGPWGEQVVRLGDDCAAIPDGDGYLLFAMEGMSPQLVTRAPRAAGYCSVLVNASDIYAMGGRPIAVVNALFSTDTDPEAAAQILTGMRRAAQQLGIPIVGGHTHLQSPYTALAASILGRAKALITSFDAQPGDEIVMAVDLRGKMHAGNPFWDATDAPPERMRRDYEVLPELAEAGLCRAGKDISMGGLLGSLLMLLESSGVGASVDLARIQRPQDIDWPRWLAAFPSYGFVLAVSPGNHERVSAMFGARGLGCASIGTFDDTRRLALTDGSDRIILWDLTSERLTTSPAPENIHA